MGPESNRLQCGVRFTFPLHHRVCSLVRSPGIAQRPNCRLEGPARAGSKFGSQGVLDGADIGPFLWDLLPRYRVFHRIAGAVVLTFSLCNLQV